MAVVYRPSHANQIQAGGPTGPFDCTAWSAAFAIDRATLGGVKVTGRQVRLASSEPIPSPSSPGLNLQQVADVAAKWHVDLNYRLGSFIDVLAALAAFRGVILQGDYDQMGTWSCQPSFKGDHAVFLNSLDTAGTRALTYDPLCAAYRWVPIGTLKRYCEKHAASTGGKVRYATTRVTPLIAKH